MRTLCLFLSLIGFAAMPELGNADIAIDTTITIKPGNADEATDRLIEQAEQLEGYFVTRSNTYLELKVPSQAANKLQQFIENTWLIYQQDYQAKDITAQLIEAQSNLKAKEDLLDEYQKILASAQSGKLVKVSTAVTTLIQEIELLRGRINFMQHQIRFAKFTVNFQIDRGTVNTRRITSSFPWLNSVGLPNLLSDFSQ